MNMMNTNVVCFLKLVGAILVLLLLYMSNYFGVVIAAKHVGCIEKERHALLDLKASLVLEDTHLLSSWDNKSDGCCAWEGVVCSNQTGHVEMLDLNGVQFGPFPGEINASLIELRHLKRLNFSFKGLRNSNNIPIFFGSLSNLRFLDLKSSYFWGRIPNDLFRLSHLQYLDLSMNKLEGTIPHQLGNISCLQYLDLSENDLEGRIPHQLGNLSRLQQLILSWNNLAGIIPPQLGNLFHLQHLDLSLNNLAGTIPHQLGSLSNLQELNLEFNSEGLKVDDKFDDKNDYVGSQWLSNLTLLTHLDLSGVQNLTHVWLQIIVKLPKLQELKLSSCHLSDLSLSHSKNELHGGLLESFKDICTLQLLELDSNNFNDDISTILLKLSGCARYSLQYLHLMDNQITGSFPDFSIFSSLTSINLSHNLLSGKILDGDKILPPKLESLEFGYNSLEGGIPKSIGNLCSLQSLRLGHNKLNEDLSAILHNLSVGCAKYSLQELYLDGNQIIGTIHDMLEFLVLHSLSLSENLLNGRIPKNYTFPYQLETLYLDSNNLEGVITESHFTNMSRLQYLNLSYNPLALKISENWVPPFQLIRLCFRSYILGPSFPKWLQSQNNLQELDISDAQISDAVPVWFWTQAKYIRFMNISYNNLTGTIPNLPITFSKDCQLIMDSNQFEGSIPPFFRSATLLRFSKNKFSETHLLLCTNIAVDRLRILDLSENQLTRQLPDCLSLLKALEFLDLSRNSLSGEVPYSMGSLLKLKVLILRNNNFNGKLPDSLKNCTELIMLDLGDNRFSGPIPYWLGQKLQILSLRRNRFHGSLPQSLCYLINIQLLDLSENNLSGRIFKCLKNFSAMSRNDSLTKMLESSLMYPIQIDAYQPYTGYDLNALLMWKGEERLFKNNELILRSIDLSGNQLTGDIPEEIGNLIELRSLNLSGNNLTGEITSKIGNLTLLEFLDLSRNNFFGPIPSSLTQIHQLALLNVSNNNLSGRIPIGTQLQSFDTSCYEGNVDLCGKPLDKECPEDEEVVHLKPEREEESNLEDKTSIYVSVSLGFITGFWGLWGSLLIIRKWRHAYMLFLNNIIDTTYVFLVLNATKFQRWLRGLLERFQNK